MSSSPGISLDRFVRAQQPVIQRVRRELEGGRKRSHWMWFVFPQIAGLGHSATSRFYAIQSLDEARAYLAHPVLGPRLEDCIRLVLNAPGTANDIFGSPDDVKFRSCLTLFQLANPNKALLQEALERFFDGVVDPRTIALCGGPVSD